MKRDNGEPSVRLQQVLGGCKATLEFAKFIVDVNAEGLKSPGGGVAAIGFATEQAGDQAGELRRRRKWRCLAIMDDGAGNQAGLALLAILVKYARDVFLWSRCEEICCRGAAAGHAHVEGAVVLERETALWPVELHGRHANVEHDSIDEGHGCRVPDRFRAIPVKRLGVGGLEPGVAPDMPLHFAEWGFYQRQPGRDL